MAKNKKDKDKKDKDKKKDKGKAGKTLLTAGNGPTVRLSAHALAAELKAVSKLADSLLAVIDPTSAAYSETENFIKHISQASVSIQDACSALKGNPMYRDFRLGSAQ